jgi:hypothetical protein
MNLNSLKSAMFFAATALCLALGISSSYASPSAQPHQTIVLLTSANFEKPEFSLRTGAYYRGYARRLEGELREFFSNEAYTIVVKHLADHDGFDLKGAFQSIHPNLRVLAVIGCKSRESLMFELRAQGLYRKNPNLAVLGFDSKIDAQVGLQKAMRLSEMYLPYPAVARGYGSPCSTQKGYALTVARYLPEPKVAGATIFYPAVRVEHGGVVLGSFPAIHASGYQLTTIHISAEKPIRRTNDLKLVFNAGINNKLLPGQVELGEYHFSPSWRGAHWNIFSSAQGEPIGVTSRVYRYDGTLPLDAGAVDYAPFECADMPALSKASP